MTIIGLSIDDARQKKLPHYDGLRLAGLRSMVEADDDCPNYFPLAKHQWAALPRDFYITILHTVRPVVLKAQVDRVMKARKEHFQDEKGDVVELNPRLHKAYKESKEVGSKYSRLVVQ